MRDRLLEHHEIVFTGNACCSILGSEECRRILGREEGALGGMSVRDRPATGSGA
jgi:hypothetical protein